MNKYLIFFIISSVLCISSFSQPILPQQQNPRDTISPGDTSIPPEETKPPEVITTPTGASTGKPPGAENPVPGSDGTQPTTPEPSVSKEQPQPSFPPPLVQEITEDEFDFLDDPILETQDVESFYSTAGLALFPKKKNFSWRNIFRNTIYYNSNLYYAQKKTYVSSDWIYASSIESQFEYKPLRQLELDLKLGFQFEDYLDENEQKFLPKVELEARWKHGPFYAIFQDRFGRNSALITGEVNAFSPWFKNTCNITLGFTYDRWLFEITSFHEYLNYEDFRGDYQFYGQNYTIGYRISPGIYITGSYGWDIIDYRDATSIYEKRLYDTMGQSWLVGLRLERILQLTRNVGIYVGTGAQERDDKWYWRTFVTLDWKFMEFDTRRFKLELTLGQQTQPSLLGDFRYTISAAIGARYLITRDWAAHGEFTVAYNDPINAKTSMNYSWQMSLTYRIAQGIDAEIFYRFNMVTSDDITQKFTQHLVGASLVIIF